MSGAASVTTVRFWTAGEPEPDQKSGSVVVRFAEPNCESGSRFRNFQKLLNLSGPVWTGLNLSQKENLTVPPVNFAIKIFYLSFHIHCQSTMRSGRSSGSPAKLILHDHSSQGKCMLPTRAQFHPHAPLVCWAVSCAAFWIRRPLIDNENSCQLCTSFNCKVLINASGHSPQWERYQTHGEWTRPRSQIERDTSGLAARYQQPRQLLALCQVGQKIRWMWGCSSDSNVSNGATTVLNVLILKFTCTQSWCSTSTDEASIGLGSKADNDWEDIWYAGCNIRGSVQFNKITVNFNAWKSREGGDGKRKKKNINGNPELRTSDPRAIRSKYDHLTHLTTTPHQHKLRWL